MFVDWHVENTDRLFFHLAARFRGSLNSATSGQGPLDAEASSAASRLGTGVG